MNRNIKFASLFILVFSSPVISGCPESSQKQATIQEIRIDEKNIHFDSAILGPGAKLSDAIKILGPYDRTYLDRIYIWDAPGIDIVCRKKGGEEIESVELMLNYVVDTRRFSAGYYTGTVNFRGKKITRNTRREEIMQGLPFRELSRFDDALQLGNYTVTLSGKGPVISYLEIQWR